MSGPATPRGAEIAGLAHVAIATRDADALAGRLIDAFGAERGSEEILDGGGLRVVFVKVGPLTLELLEPRSEEHTVARFLEKRGEGLHHVSLEVADVSAALERSRRAGVEAIDARPRDGSHGTRVAFLHPRSLGGVLFELCGKEK